MGIPTKAQIEQIFDTVAAQTKAAQAGLRAAALTATNGSLFNQQDAIGDADIESVLGPAFNTYDKSLFAESTLLSSYLAQIFGAPLQTLQAQAKAAGYASLDAALTALAAKASPTIQALAAASGGLGRALSPANVFPPAVGTSDFDVVYVGADGSLTDETADAGSATTADVDIFTANGDAVYLGYNNKPTGADEWISFALSTLSVNSASPTSIAPTFKYWNGSAWADLTTDDGATTGTYGNAGTKGMRQSGVIHFAVPSDWSRTYRNPDGNAIFASDLTPRYYIRIARTVSTLSQPPVASLIQHGIGHGLVMLKSTDTAVFVAGDGVNTVLYGPSTKLTLRALTDIGANVTPTVSYTDQNGVASSQAQSAWSATHDAGGVYNANAGLLAFASPDTGATAITGVTATVTSPTAGAAFVVESVALRTEVA